MKSSLPRVGAIAAAMALLAALSVPTTASAAGAVQVKGHITTYSGKPVPGVLVELKAKIGDRYFDKGVKTSATGRYSVTVTPGVVYELFIGESSDDQTDVPEFVAKTGHIRVGSSDYRLDKSLHHAD